MCCVVRCVLLSGGEGQGQLIAVVTIVAIIGFIIFKTLPVYWREQNVRNELTDMARKYAIGAKGFATEKELEGQWLKISNEFNVPQEAKFTADRQGGRSFSKCSTPNPSTTWCTRTIGKSTPKPRIPSGGTKWADAT